MCVCIFELCMIICACIFVGFCKWMCYFENRGGCSNSHMSIRLAKPHMARAATTLTHSTRPNWGGSANTTQTNLPQTTTHRHVVAWMKLSRLFPAFFSKSSACSISKHKVVVVLKGSPIKLVQLLNNMFNKLGYHAWSSPANSFAQSNNVVGVSMWFEELCVT